MSVPINYSNPTLCQQFGMDVQKFALHVGFDTASFAAGAAMFTTLSAGTGAIYGVVLSVVSFLAKQLFREIFNTSSLRIIPALAVKAISIIITSAILAYAGLTIPPLAGAVMFVAAVIASLILAAIASCMWNTYARRAGKPQINVVQVMQYFTM